MPELNSMNATNKLLISFQEFVTQMFDLYENNFNALEKRVEALEEKEDKKEK